MPIKIFKDKKCAVCKQIITFEDFCINNPSISSKRAQEFWEDSFFLIYCPDCYFDHPDKPFRIKKGYFNYNSRTYRKFK